MNNTTAILQLIQALLQNEGPTNTGSTSETDFDVGDKVFIRTVTMIFTGRVKKVTDRFIHLEDSAWIADTGRFNQALATGSLSEVEPYPHGNAVTISSIIDFTKWEHNLPTEVK